MATAFTAEGIPVIALTETSLRIGSRIDAMANVALQADIADHLTVSLDLSDPTEPTLFSEEMIDRVPDEAIRWRGDHSPD